MKFGRQIGWMALGACMASAVAYAAPQEGGVRLLMMSAKTQAQGYLGVGIRDVGEEQVSALHLKDTHGAEIVQVDHDGPAGKAGLREHDVILQMNGQMVEGAEPLRAMLRGTTPGKVVSFVIYRDGQQQTVKATLADQALVERQAWQQHMTVPEPSPEASFAAFANGFFSGSPMPPPDMGRAPSTVTPLLGPSYTGAMLEPLGAQLAEFFGAMDGGLLVRNVDKNSPAAAAGMKAGDVVVRVNAAAVGGGGDWLRMMRVSAGKGITVVVVRDKHEITLTLIPDTKRRSAVEWGPRMPIDPAQVLAMLRGGLPMPEADLWFNQ